MPDRDAKTLLIVEDDDATFSALKGLFIIRKWHVARAASVSDAVAQLAARPRAVLLDLMLPDGSGEAVLAAARSAGIGSRFVVVTGIPDEARRRAVLALGAHAFLTKPVNVAELYRAVEGPEESKP